ncbi:MAG: thioesterase family protein [Syntrophobacterales bacterium]|nr:thioesterase family protein [Syntrophobacterales bacterium]
MALPSLKEGLTHEVSLKTSQEHSAQKFFHQVPNVFATPFLGGLMEQACAELIHPHLEEGEQSVGATMELKHLAPTPLGMTVTARATLKEIKGKQLIFHVEAFDEIEKIGEGIHHRFIINAEKFNQRVTQKAQSKTS